MKLIFIDENGRKILLDSEPSASIQDIRHKLFELTGQFGHIEIDGKKIPVSDNKLIQDYQISELSCLKLLPTSKEEILNEMEAYIVEELSKLTSSSCAQDDLSDMHPHHVLKLDIELDSSNETIKYSSMRNRFLKFSQNIQKNERIGAEDNLEEIKNTALGI
ncbi:hypothetical protein [Legionella saoudiensis]|uniref:hypothetical protein n=1 Tax=Legionella saoudiensis TaxID=1750561 RepID=UPI00073162A4|nr:hypothetical protein [Legionella saoudiensis]